MMEIKVRSVGDFMRQIGGICKPWNPESDPEWLPWFRGEGNADWPFALRPRLYRQKHKRLKFLLHLDQELRLEFRRRGAQLIIGQRPADKWEWYFLMQHYGVPTRLLDWTDGALVALYFAVKSRKIPGDREGEAPAVVYMLDPWWLNDQAFKRLKDPPEGVALSDWPEVQKYLPKELSSERLKPSIPVAIDPTHLSSRIAAQRSRFTIFGTEVDGLRLVTKKRDCKFTKILVEASAIPAIQGDLRRAGVSESSIFPDLEGLSRELNFWWEEECRH